MRGPESDCVRNPRRREEGLKAWRLGGPLRGWLGNARLRALKASGRQAYRMDSSLKEEAPMLLVREIMFCKPGKARPMVEKFRSLSKILEKHQFGSMRVTTDVSSERYWMVVSGI